MAKEYLLTPGPTPVPEEARLAMARSLIHHRGQAFREVFEEVRQGLGWLFETTQPVLTITASGTGTFEAAMINFTRREDTIICVGGGKFGERWAEVGRAYGMNVVELAIRWGEAIEPAALRQALKDNPNCTMVTLSASETSTGVIHPVEELSELIHAESSALFAVDAITALGVHRVPMDALKIDVLVTGSQKAFGLPPGLGFVAASERAWERAERSDHPRYYFDLRREKKKQLDNQTAFTPGITQIVAAKEVLGLMREEGLQELVARHERNAEATRAGVQALGLKLFAQRPGNAVTAIVSPEGVAAPDIVQRMAKDHGAIISGGQDALKSTVFRIGHIGFFERVDMLNALSALELTLASLGVDVTPGAALSAAQRVYAGV